MTRYRVELWIVGASPDPDRMPDVNVPVRAKSAERALRAAELMATRAAYGSDRLARFLGVEVEDSNVYDEGAR
jgi:hypothetical protein